MSNITVTDTDGNILKEFAFDQVEASYKYALEMEEMGIDVKLHIPSVTDNLQTHLGDALKLDPEIQAQYKRSVESELEDHDGIEGKSCCDP